MPTRSVSARTPSGPFSQLAAGDPDRATARATPRGVGQRPLAPPSVSFAAEASGFLVGPPVFKTGVGVKAPRRVRFPSASAASDRHACEATQTLEGRRARARGRPVLSARHAELSRVCLDAIGQFLRATERGGMATIDLTRS